MHDAILAAMRDSDESRFITELQKLVDSRNLEIAISTRYTDWFSGFGLTLLQLVVFVRPKLAEHVIKAGANIDLHSACSLGDIETIERLLAEHPQAITETIDTYFPIQYALRNLESLRTLLNHGDDPNRIVQKVGWFDWEDKAAARGTSDWRLMHMVALGRDKDAHLAAEVLRAAGADLCLMADAFGLAPIHLSAIYDRVQLIRWFVENGCEVDARTADTGDSQSHGLYDTKPFSPFYTHDQTPLMLSLGEGQANAAQLLVQQGTDVNARDSGGFTPLHYASGPFWHETPTLIKLLLDQGADINVKSNDGMSPLDLAVEKKYEKTIAVLSD